MPQLVSSPAPIRYDRHLPALDGVRGLALIAVLFGHATLAREPTNLIERAYYTTALLGWSGVDLFFVLSGFLITGILFDTKDTGSFFRTFYARRVLRILPLYYTLLFLWYIVRPTVRWGVLGEPFALDPDAWWYVFFLSNFFMGLQDWFGGPMEGVSWSLAIEEQFYLIWPLLVFNLRRGTLLRLCSGLLFLALVLRAKLLWLNVSPYMIFAATPTRMDGLLVGAIIALLVREEEARARLARLAPTLFLITGVMLTAMTAAIHYFPHESDYYVPDGYAFHPFFQFAGYTLLAVFFGAFMSLAIEARREGWFHRALAWRPLRSVGKYSYAMYLLHLPVMLRIQWKLFDPVETPLLGSVMLAQFVFFVAGFAATYFVSMASWYILERPFLRLKRHFPYEPARERERAPASVGALVSPPGS